MEAGLEAVAGRLGRGGRCGISIVSVFAAGAKRCGICGRWTDEECCNNG